MMIAAQPRHVGVIGSFRKESWADVEDDSRCSAPLFDDSYSEAPLPGLENSKDGLNKRLKGAVDLVGSGPTDFAFLLEKSGVGKDGVWRLNSAAQEFIPTLTFSCPLVGICHVLPKERDNIKEETSNADACTTAGNTPASTFSAMSPSIQGRSRECTLEAWDLEGKSRTMSSPIFAAAAFDADGIPTKPRSMSNVSMTSPVFTTLPSPVFTALPGPKKRCKPSSIQVPPRKRIKSEERRELLVPDAQLEGSAAEEDQQHCSASVAGSVVDMLNGVVPEATDEDWQRREEARRKCVQIGKDTEEYRCYLASRPNKDDREASEPTTPDPRDRTVSKRRWGQSMNEWRQALKAYAE